MSDEIVLGIESAIAGGSICLAAGGREVGSWVGDQSVSKAEELLPNIDRLLRENDLTVDKIDSIIVSTGPGSFTGIKVGISTVLGLRAALGVTCVGLNLLRALSLQKPGDEIMALVPVGRGTLCIQSFKASREISPPELLYDNDVTDEIFPTSQALVVHALLHNRFPNAIDAGWNMASYLCAAADSDFVSTDLRPLFVERKSANI